MNNYYENLGSWEHLAVCENPLLCSAARPGELGPGSE